MQFVWIWLNTSRNCTAAPRSICLLHNLFNKNAPNKLISGRSSQKNESLEFAWTFYTMIGMVARYELSVSRVVPVFFIGFADELIFVFQSASPVLDGLDPNGMIMYRLFRDATKYENGTHVKVNHTSSVSVLSYSYLIRLRILFPYCTSHFSFSVHSSRFSFFSFLIFSFFSPSTRRLALTFRFQVTLLPFSHSHLSYLVLIPISSFTFPPSRPIFTSCHNTSCFSFRDYSVRISFRKLQLIFTYLLLSWIPSFSQLSEALGLNWRETELKLPRMFRDGVESLGEHRNNQRGTKQSNPLRSCLIVAEQTRVKYVLKTVLFRRGDGHVNQRPCISEIPIALRSLWHESFIYITRAATPGRLTPQVDPQKSCFSFDVVCKVYYSAPSSRPVSCRAN